MKNFPNFQGSPRGIALIVKSYKDTRIGRFFIFLIAGVVFYLADCLFNFRQHPDLPWYATGMYETTPRGFVLNVIFVVFAVAQLLLARD